MILQIFFSFLKIGFFCFGGGYAILPLIEKEVIIAHGWITYAQFIDIVAIAEMTPGPVAINMATFVGYRTAGIPGAIASTTGVILPSLLLTIIISRFLQMFYEVPAVQAVFRGLRPAVIALITLAAIMVIRTSVSIQDLGSIAILLITFSLLTFSRVNPILVILGAGLLGLIIY